MEMALAITLVVALLLLVMAGWLATLVGLPGNWLILATASIYGWLVPAERTIDVGWNWIGALLVLAVLGELFEFLAGAVGTAHAGGSRRSAVFALVGSFTGGITGAIVGVPIPIVGSLVGALLFSGLGAAAGAIFGEWSRGEELRNTMRVGQGAFLGRLLGTGAKVLVGSVMATIVLVALCTE
jgi:uncharacterized protein YqgC (DUF456 family)